MNDESKTPSSPVEEPRSKTTEVARVGTVWIALKVEHRDDALMVSSKDGLVLKFVSHDEDPSLFARMNGHDRRYFFGEKFQTQDGRVDCNVDSCCVAPDQDW